MFHFYEAMPTQGFVITFVVWWYYYNLYAQYAATFFLALTRFTALLFPTRHKKVSPLALLSLLPGIRSVGGSASCRYHLFLLHFGRPQRTLYFVRSAFTQENVVNCRWTPYVLPLLRTEAVPAFYLDMECADLCCLRCDSRATTAYHLVHLDEQR